MIGLLLFVLVEVLALRFELYIWIHLIRSTILSFFTAVFFCTSVRTESREFQKVCAANTCVLQEPNSLRATTVFFSVLLALGRRQIPNGLDDTSAVARLLAQNEPSSRRLPDKFGRNHFFFLRNRASIFFFNMEEVVCSHLGPLPIVLSASAFLCNTNFVVVFQAVCREWRRWCRHVEEHHTRDFHPCPARFKTLCPIDENTNHFPCGTYERIQNLTVSASRPSRYLYLDQNSASALPAGIGF